MGQVLNGSATTMNAIRAAIQRSQASVTELSQTYGINPKTDLKWKKRPITGSPAGAYTGRLKLVRKDDRIRQTTRSFEIE